MGGCRVNGETVLVMGTRVDLERDVVEVDGIRLELEVEPRYFLLNKPPGYVTTLNDPEGRPTILDLFKERAATSRSGGWTCTAGGCCC